MANPNLITVKQLKELFLQAVRDLEDMDESRPINLAYGDPDDQKTSGFLTKISIDVHPSMDEEQSDVNVDINWTEA